MTTNTQRTARLPRRTAATPKALVPGTLVTVTLTENDGTAYTFHGTALEIETLCVKGYENAQGTAYNYTPADRILGEPTDYGFDAPTEWLRVYSATGNPFPVAHAGGGWGIPARDTVAAQGPDWYFGLYDFYVRLNAETVTVRIAGKAGREWVMANLSLDHRRKMLIEQVTALDPTLGEAVDRLVEDIHEAAFESGKDSEWHSSNDY